MNLSGQILSSIAPDKDIDTPSPGIFSLPEKVLQFGTGVLLRGLPDFFIDKANKQGLFEGRVVMVKSTSGDGVESFHQQDHLYTHLVRGLEAGKEVNNTIINASISRVLTASTQWKEVLAAAADPGIQIIISNTTEVGITLLVEDVISGTPVSFPGKLLACLLARYEKPGNDVKSGLVIIPTELIPGNGDKLKNIVIELAWLNNLDPAFIQWIGEANDFCNSLVDRIVPGKLPADRQSAEEKRIGYSDEWMIMSEPYRLWAIETSSPTTEALLSFAAADNSVIIAPDISVYRELKLRLLNGTHTFSCGLAILLGFKTVREAMADDSFRSFVKKLMLQEIIPAITSNTISTKDAEKYAASVIDRFSNPFIDHPWINICLQYSSKMKMRNMPLLQALAEKNEGIPEHMALGMAAYILFMKSVKTADNQYQGNLQGTNYTIHDDSAVLLHEYWQAGSTEQVVRKVLSSDKLWGTHHAMPPGFEDSVIRYLGIISSKDYLTVLDKFEPANTHP